jgi:hypothetical protein
MKKIIMCAALLCSLSGTAQMGFSESRGESLCYDIGANFARQRAVRMCSARGGFHHSRLVVRRSCIKAALSGCKDTLVAAIRSLQDSGDCSIRPFSVLAAELLKERECKKLLDIAVD